MEASHKIIMDLLGNPSDLCFPVNGSLILDKFIRSCLVGILANTPGVVKRSGLGAHACWVISHVLKGN